MIVTINPCPNQRQMRVAEYAFGILHDLSGFVPLPDLRKMVYYKIEMVLS